MIDIPVLVMHGEDDQICPFPTTGARSVKLLKHGTLKSYPGFPHGMPTCWPSSRPNCKVVGGSSPFRRSCRLLFFCPQSAETTKRGSLDRVFTVHDWGLGMKVAPAAHVGATQDAADRSRAEDALACDLVAGQMPRPSQRPSRSGCRAAAWALMRPRTVVQ